MIIANPIYDTTFKMLMQDNESAKFLVGTILDCEVISLVESTKERTFFHEDSSRVTPFLMDFAATIRTEDGETKKVLIELQKSQHYIDIARFRKYLGSEYVYSDLPIITIYILGFNLESESPAFKTTSECVDLITNEKLEVRDHFVKQLTHTAYFIQIKRIKPEYNTKLEKLLSIFEQANFLDNTSKRFKGIELIDIESGLNRVVNRLNLIAADKDAREKLENEEYYQLHLEAIYGKESRKAMQLDSKLMEAAKELKKMGADTDTIAKITELSIEEIEKL